jgi:hypothetical protein
MNLSLRKFETVRLTNLTLTANYRTWLWRRRRREIKTIMSDISFYYPSILNSRKACPSTSMSNMPIECSERKAGFAGPRIQAFSRTHHNIQTSSDHGENRKKIVRDNCTFYNSSSRHYRSFYFCLPSTQNRTRPRHNKHLTCPPLDGATFQFLRSRYSGEHEKLLLRLLVNYLQ